MSLARDASGRARSGWVVLTFVVVAVVTESLLLFAREVAGLRHATTLDAPQLLFSSLPTLASGVTATWATWRFFGVPTGLADRRPGRRFAQGAALGALALTACALGPLLAGAGSLTRGHGTLGDGVLQLMLLAPAGLGEELLLRGLGFVALRRGLGDVAAVAAGALLFGALHLDNPHVSATAALGVGLVGAWCGALQVRTGSVWLPAGLHVAWNFSEGTVFGLPVSGLRPRASLLAADWPAEAGFWSGGAFGPEGAGFTALVLALATALTVAWPGRRSLTPLG